MLRKAVENCTEAGFDWQFTDCVGLFVHGTEAVFADFGIDSQMKNVLEFADMDSS